MNYFIYCKDKKISANQKPAIDEYAKRLSPYCKTKIISGNTKIKTDDMKSGNHQVVLVENGYSTFSSEDFAEEIKKYEASGKSNLHIFIGYSKEEVRTFFTEKNRMDFSSFSISSLDLPVQTLCILLYEQIYRSYTMINGKTYHK